MKNRLIWMIALCFVLIPALYLGFVFMNEGPLGIYGAISSTKPVEHEGEKDWQYTMKDGTEVGVGMSYQTRPGFIDNYIRSHQTVYVFLRNGNHKTIVSTIDLTKYKPFKDIDYYEVVKIEPDDEGCRILYYWMDERGYFPQVIRNIPLDPKASWLGKVDRLSKQDRIPNDFQDYMTTKL